jgi:Domain of unknown function (DUF4440)
MPRLVFAPLLFGLGLLQLASATTRHGDVKSTLAAKYASVTVALRHQDLGTVGAILAPDYKAYGPKGDSISRDQVLSDFKRQAMSLTNISWTRQLSSLVASGRSVSVTVSGHFSGTTLGKERHQLDLYATTFDTWARFGADWKLTSSRLKQSRMMLDGKPFKPGH